MTIIVQFFVAMDKVNDFEAAQVAKVTKGDASDSPTSRSSSTDHNNSESFNVSDHVVFYDKYNKIVRGIVKSVGPSLVEIKLVSVN